MSFVSQFIELAGQEVGVSEVPRGSNTGPRVKEYQRRAGYDEPVAWCMCFLYWCIDEACKKLNIPNRVLRTGGCDEIRHWASRHECLVDSPRAGDLGLVMKTPSDATHIFLITSVEGNVMHTIEGNTNDEGSREGYEVCRRKRTMGPKYKFVRPSIVLGDGEPDAEPKPKQMILVGPNGAEITKMDVVRGTSRAPVRLVAKAVGFKNGEKIGDTDIKWDAEDQSIEIKGKPLPEQVTVIEGVSYVPLRKLADFLGWTVEVDGQRVALK